MSLGQDKPVGRARDRATWVVTGGGLLPWASCWASGPMFTVFMSVCLCEGWRTVHGSDGVCQLPHLGLFLCHDCGQLGACGTQIPVSSLPAAGRAGLCWAGSGAAGTGVRRSPSGPTVRSPRNPGCFGHLSGRRRDSVSPQ